MKKTISVILCLVMVLALMAGCGSSAPSAPAQNAPAANSGAAGSAAPAPATEAEANEFHVLYSSELTTLNYLITSNSAEQAIGANVIDTLVEYNAQGEIVASLAESWSFDEATNSWTFNIREGQKWVDSTGAVVGDVTAQDFVDAMAYMLDPANGSSTIELVFGIIENAEEYFNGLAGEEGFEPIDFEEVGVKALDTYTLQYTLAADIPYFESMMTYVVFMPAYGPMLEELGTSFGTSADTMLYNGAFYISAYEPQQQLVLTKNTNNWDAEHVYLDAVVKTYNAEADTIGPEMVKRGEIDYCELSADVVDAWMNDPATSNMVSMERPALDFAYFYCFNFNMRALNEDFYRDGMTGWSVDEKYEPANWEKAVNNEAFRQAIAHAINRISTVHVATGDYADPATYIQNTITPAGFSVDASTGLDFAATGALAKCGETYDKDLAASFKAQAMEELAGKVTFPVKVLVRYNPSTTNWEQQTVVLEQQLESVLGTDFIDIQVEAGPSDGFLSAVRRGCDYMLLLCNWGADYADPETWTDPFYQALRDDGTYNRGMRYAYLAYAITDETESADTVKTYFELVEAAKEITSDTTARYNAFAEAEAYLIEHALAVPYGTSVANYVATRVNPWDGQYAAFGVSNLRYKGQSLMDHFLSMEEFEASALR